jgi:hypothetical protein
LGKKFDIDNLLTQLNNRVIIAGDNLTEDRGGLLNAPGVQGIMLNDLSINGSNDFSQAVQSQVADKLSGVVDTLSTGVGALGQFGGADGGAISEAIQNFAPRTLGQTIMRWGGSSKPVFNISLLFLKIRTRDNIAQKVTSLYQTVLPLEQDQTVVGGNSLTRIRAPLGYIATTEKVAQGTLALSVGSWFRATNLVMRDVSFTFSKEVSTDGFPLYAVGSVTLEPFRMISFREFEAYFISQTQAANIEVGNPPGTEIA